MYAQNEQVIKDFYGRVIGKVYTLYNGIIVCHFLIYIALNESDIINFKWSKSAVRVNSYSLDRSGVFLVAS